MNLVNERSTALADVAAVLLDALHDRHVDVAALLLDALPWLSCVQTIACPDAC